MLTREWTTIDKDGWPDGPWHTEPDKRQWPDPATGLACLAVRHPSSGHWCGYVGVPRGHPMFEKHYDDDALASAEIHGGLTYAAECAAGPAATSICHVDDEAHEGLWWLGFDCAHAWDYSPARHSISYLANLKRVFMEGPMDGEEYRDLPYVEAECAKLAAVLAAVE